MCSLHMRVLADEHAQWSLVCEVHINVATTGYIKLILLLLLLFNLYFENSF